MSTLRTFNLQNPDSGTVNIEMDQGGNTLMTGIATVRGAAHFTSTSGSDAVGIGTDITAYKLDVRVTGAEAGLRVYNPDTSSNASGILRLGNDDNQNAAFLRLNGSNNTSAVGGAGSLVLGHGLSKDLHLSTAGVSRLKITSAGNVGVGADPTQARLVAQTTSGSSLAAIKDNTGGSIVIGGVTQPRILMEAGHNASEFRIYSAGGSSYGSASWTERLRITSGGNLQLYSGGNLQMASNGRIFVGDGGNATDPMFANVSDTNTGIAFPAADTMMFTTGGSERLRIHSSGVAQFTTTGTQYVSASAPAFVVNSNGDHALVINNQNTTDPRGLFIYQDQDVNNGTSYFLRARAGGTDRAHLYSNGTLQLHSGNLKLASGNGIDFSANSNASGMTSELLDDYEEGTSTVSIQNITADTNEVLMKYTKIGSVVCVVGVITIVNKTVSSGANGWFHLPFAPSAHSTSVPGCSIQKNSINTNVAYLGFYGQNTILLLYVKSWWLSKW